MLEKQQAAGILRYEPRLRAWEPHLQLLMLGDWRIQDFTCTNSHLKLWSGFRFDHASSNSFAPGFEVPLKFSRHTVDPNACVTALENTTVSNSTQQTGLCGAGLHSTG